MSPIRALITILPIIFVLFVAAECGKPAPNSARFRKIERNLRNYSRNYKANKYNIIFPGTLWCGSGDIAGKNRTRLGRHRATDHCCRQHDHCTDTILAKTRRYNLSNTSQYTISNCACDDLFLKCLKNTCSEISALIGIIYFHVLDQKCFMKCPKSGCQPTVNSNSTRRTHVWRDGQSFDAEDAISHLRKCFVDTMDEAEGEMLEMLDGMDQIILDDLDFLGEMIQDR